MSDRTRRQFLEVAGATAAAAVVAPTALAAAQSPVPGLPALPELPGVPEAPVPALPVGPTAPYSGYQSEIYIAGMSTGVKPAFTTNLSGLEAAADDVLTGAARKHLLAVAGGAAAVRANAAALAAWRIVPRMFIDRAERDHETTVLGVTMPAPIILGPVGRQALAHRDAEPGSARAAAALGLTYVHAPDASTPPEAVAPIGSRWLGLDWPDAGGPDTVRLTRAKAAGYTHLVLTPPPRGTGWRALAQVRRAWDGPIVLGGVQSVPDATAAVRRGFDGVVVTNERGRRGPASAGTIDDLPKIADAVGGKAAVLFGAGARTGTDVFRALALGADAIVIGRPYVHGLALGGEAGVRHVLRTLLAELDITRAIAGVATRRELGRDALVRV